MMNEFLLSSLLTIVWGLGAFGRLINTPSNQYTFLDRTISMDMNISMSCSSTLGSRSINWYLVQVGSKTNVTIASGSTVYSEYAQLYRIDQPIEGESNLIISSPTDSTAGTFTCSDGEKFAHAQLMVLHSISQSTNATDDPIIGDVIRYSCNLVYLQKPFFNPILYLYRFPPSEELDNKTSLESEISNSLTTVTANFYQTASCLSFLNMQCVLKFEQPATKGNLLPGSATNDLSPAFAFNFATVRVTCPPSITGAVSGGTLKFGAVLTCQLTVPRPVNYSWIDLTNGNSIIGPQLTVLNNGSYQCIASINSGDLLSTSVAAVYNLTVKINSLIQPSYGPIAGGTNVTLTLENWSKDVANISVVYIGDFIKSKDLLYQSGSVGNYVVMRTPSAPAALIGQQLPITIEFTPGPYNVSTSSSFTYRGNPEITGISPTTFVATGGTTVNVTGTQLSSVANPFIQVILVVERGIERNTTAEKSLGPCEVDAENGSAMTCRMPSVNIPDDFLQVLDSLHNSRSKRDTDSMNHLRTANPFLLSRRKRYANALSLTGPNGVDRIVISLGFILGGYKKYENINNVLPNTQIIVFSPPEINFTRNVIDFDPNKDELISIKGEHMTRGCRVVDYVVKVGDDICENIDLTDNQLRCRPPKQQPQSKNNTSIYCDRLVSVQIHLGFKTYQYACMKYSTRPLALIIGLAVGLSSFVIIILLIIAIVCCCKRSRNRRNKSTNIILDTNSTSAASEAYETQSDQLYANAAYLQLSATPYADESYLQPSTPLHASGSYMRPSSQ